MTVDAPWRFLSTLLVSGIVFESRAYITQKSVLQVVGRQPCREVLSIRRAPSYLSKRGVCFQGFGNKLSILKCGLVVDVRHGMHRGPECNHVWCFCACLIRRLWNCPCLWRPGWRRSLWRPSRPRARLLGLWWWRCSLWRRRPRARLLSLWLWVGGVCRT